MQYNVNNTDRVIRLILGIIFLATAFLGGVSSVMQVLLVVLAVIALGTGSVRFCPLYRLLGISTVRDRPHS